MNPGLEWKELRDKIQRDDNHPAKHDSYEKCQRDQHFTL